MNILLGFILGMFSLKYVIPILDTAINYIDINISILYHTKNIELDTMMRNHKSKFSSKSSYPIGFMSALDKIEDEDNEEDESDEDLNMVS